MRELQRNFTSVKNIKKIMKTFEYRLIIPLLLIIFTAVRCADDESPADASCTDGTMNGTETGIDCGGSCAPCPSCTDGIMNGEETGVDCGGSCSVCSSLEIIFEDDFNVSNTNSGLGDDWEIVNTPDNVVVKIQDEKVSIVPDEDGADAAFVIVKNLNVSDDSFAIRAKANFPNNSSTTVGLMGRLDASEGLGYSLLIEDGQIKLFKFAGNDAVELEGKDITWTANALYHLELVFESSTITGAIYNSDGDLVESVTGTDTEYTSGSVGILGKSGSLTEVVLFDDFQVYKE